ncbi:CRISPR-associated helicase Cas3' [Jatrophihabitans lederbergiae]|uniref:CRISPR-associated helicase Cas3 n=1 Tax=Jatrophihabitans lederbergiae TaxID=3075547 RepID=A0ABU2JFP1_9ACTN|nr:CRISPR-associated helicase Cas3' [Jatrophihabitans sp. DSM 44399]MDT0263795.1 CRISPR-associated helicase Cas3' [Jatrophihabitans sp. DSM 44399]
MSENLDRLWAKTDTSEHRHGATPQPHRIIAHLTDTSEVAGVMYDQWLAPIVKARIDGLAPRRSALTGRNLLRWLAGIHDIGKISPAFQSKNKALSAELRHGLADDATAITAQDSLDWRHTLAGGRFLLDALACTGWSQHAEWISSVVGGHHGLWEEESAYRVKGSQSKRRHGGDEWEALRREALDQITVNTGVADVDGHFYPMLSPSPADVVLLTGLVIVADWVASNGDVMPGIWGDDRESLEQARARAERAWRTLRMHGGWNPAGLLDEDVFGTRFPHIADPRPVQQLAVDIASTMPRAGLMIVEAPMGEGKTELSLAVAEILAKRFGSDGVFFGLPTQATADAILARFVPWLASVAPGSPVALAHGKAMINQTMRDLPSWSPAGVGVDCCTGPELAAVSGWFRSSKRLLLSPFVVGTIDNVLLSGSKVRHGALRFLGLTGKVVILDEVHAADIYMSEFLERALSWLGAAGVPVILMSATLPSVQRLGLIEAYAGLDDGTGVTLLDDVDGYPRITTALAATSNAPAVISARSPKPNPATSKTSLDVRVRVLHEQSLTARGSDVADSDVADLIDHKLSGGGCALVIRNTVGRAQSLYATLKTRFPAATVVLFHSRFTAGHKDAIATQILNRLGNSTKVGVHRPGTEERFIVVATQVAEQSLDIDADILITDLCPIDLLLQRIGRMWRHRDNDPHRCTGFIEPEVWVTRMHAAPNDYANPTPLSAIYPIALLTRTAHLVQRLNGHTISLPVDIPALVSEVYDRTADIPESESEDADYDRDQHIRETTARNAAIRKATDAGIATSLPAAHGLNASSVGERVMVRDGGISVEAVLLSQRHGGYLLHASDDPESAQMLTGDGSVGSTDMDTIAGIVASTVRIPASVLIGPVLDLGPLPSWVGHPWLKESRALVLGPDDTAVLSHMEDDGSTREYLVSYSRETGLSWGPPASR